MLLQLSIKNFAIFKDTIIDFNTGFSVITGESGAGKSVFITALSLINGERALKEYIRKGCEYSSVEAVYKVNKDTFDNLTSKYEIDIEDNLLVITRQIYSESNSICRVNGKIRNLSFLKEIASYLCDIHGQYENQTLLEPSSHQLIIDKMFYDKITPINTEYLEYLKEYDSVVNFILKNSGSEQQRSLRKDILSFQINEITESKIEQLDIDDLEKQRRILENSEKYINALKESIQSIEEGDSIEKIYLSSHILEKIRDMDEIVQISQSMMNSYYILKDNFSQLKDITEEFYFDEEQYNDIIMKLELFKKLSYKYGDTIDKIRQFRENAEKQLYEIENFDNIYKLKIERIEKLENILYEKAEQLNSIRISCALEFSKSVEENLHSLEMSDAIFNVNFNKSIKKNTLGHYDFQKKGIYDIEFFISANKGIDPLPLAKIASGGEISRVMLAIKCLITSKDDVDTYIFDEIDSGISGEAAVMTAIKLSSLAKEKQVICISHLPSIAAKADHHYLIFKNSQKDMTFADIRELNHDDRIKQLAILFDGNTISQEGITHAKNLLEKMKKSN